MTKTNRAPYYRCIIPDKIFQTSNAEINIQTLLSQSCRYSPRSILCCPISGIIYYQYFPQLNLPFFVPTSNCLTLEITGAAKNLPVRPQTFSASSELNCYTFPFISYSYLLITAINPVRAPIKPMSTESIFIINS